MYFDSAFVKLIDYICAERNLKLVGALQISFDVYPRLFCPLSSYLFGLFLFPYHYEYFKTTGHH